MCCVAWQAVETLRTLLPNWLAGRFTEVFKVAASWGFRVRGLRKH
jgi:hypothetical protein